MKLISINSRRLTASGDRFKNTHIPEAVRLRRMRSRGGKGLVHFSADKRSFQANVGRKHGSVPLQPPQGDSPIFAATKSFRLHYVSLAAKIGTVPCERLRLRRLMQKYSKIVTVHGPVRKVPKGRKLIARGVSSWDRFREGIASPGRGDSGPLSPLPGLAIVARTCSRGLRPWLSTVVPPGLINNAL